MSEHPTVAEKAARKLRELYEGLRMRIQRVMVARDERKRLERARRDFHDYDNWVKYMEKCEAAREERKEPKP